MAKKNPRGDGSTVALNLPPEQVAILRDHLTDWLDGARRDLTTPERLQDPRRTRAEAEAFERLLAALDRGEVTVPDQDAYEALAAAAKGADEASNYAEVVAAHDALYGLLALLEAGQR
jgi:hypothetical protein